MTTATLAPPPVYLQQKTEELHTLIDRTAETAWLIGKTLAEVKAGLPYPQYTEWLKREFNWSIRSAQRFIQIFTYFDLKDLKDLPISTAAIYTLVASTTPEEVRETAFALARKGTRVEAKHVRAITTAAAALKEAQPGDYLQLSDDTLAKVRAVANQSVLVETPTGDTEALPLSPTHVHQRLTLTFTPAQPPTTTPTHAYRGWSVHLLPAQGGGGCVYTSTPALAYFAQTEVDDPDWLLKQAKNQIDEHITQHPRPSIPLDAFYSEEPGAPPKDSHLITVHGQTIPVSLLGAPPNVTGLNIHLEDELIIAKEGFYLDLTTHPELRNDPDWWLTQASNYVLSEVYLGSDELTPPAPPTPLPLTPAQQTAYDLARAALCLTHTPYPQENCFLAPKEGELSLTRKVITDDPLETFALLLPSSPDYLTLTWVKKHSLYLCPVPAKEVDTPLLWLVATHPVGEVVLSPFPERGKGCEQCSYPLGKGTNNIRTIKGTPDRCTKRVSETERFS